MSTLCLRQPVPDSGLKNRALNEPKCEASGKHFLPDHASSVACYFQQSKQESTRVEGRILRSAAHTVAPFITRCRKPDDEFVRKQHLQRRSGLQRQSAEVSSQCDSRERVHKHSREQTLSSRSPNNVCISHLQWKLFVFCSALSFTLSRQFCLTVSLTRSLTKFCRSCARHTCSLSVDHKPGSFLMKLPKSVSRSWYHCVSVVSCSKSFTNFCLGPVERLPKRRMKKKGTLSAGRTRESAVVRERKEVTRKRSTACCSWLVVDRWS